MSCSQVSVGQSVRGPFTAAASAKGGAVNLVDKHMLVLQVKDGVAACVYTGSYEHGHERKAGYIAVESHELPSLGWRVDGRFYVDAQRLCFVPVSKLEVVGRAHSRLLAKVEKRLSELMHRRAVQVTQYSASADSEVTGARRQAKNGVLC